VLSPLTLTSFKKGGLQRAGWTFHYQSKRESWSRRVEEEEKRG